MSVLAFDATSIASDVTVQTTFIAFGLTFAGLSFTLSVANAWQGHSAFPGDYVPLEYDDQEIADNSCEEGRAPIRNHGFTDKILKIEQGGDRVKEASSNADLCGVEAPGQSQKRKITW